MKNTEIIGQGYYVPEKVVTNDDLQKLMDTSDEWIRKRTGIEERRWVDGESTSDLALIAAQRAIESAGIKKADIELIIFATLSPDHDFPGTGCFLQTKLGIPGVPTLDIRQQCTGFIYGLSVADQFIKTGMYKNILLIGAEVHSKGLDKTTRGRDVSVLFGDGAGAVVLQGTDKVDTGILSSHLFADGTHAKELWVPAPGMAMDKTERFSQSAIEEGHFYPKMNGKKVFTHAIKGMGQAIEVALAKNNLKIEDVDFFLFHQANLRINEMIGQNYSIPSSKVLNTIQKYGNTTAATIPIGLCEAVEAGVLKKGMLTMTVAFGAGFTWGSNLFRY